MSKANAGDDPALPETLRSRESELVEGRRRVAGVATDEPTAALALSGGGIRSATFSLGVLQSLAKQRLLRRFDYLSTVSGGGYAGGFLGSLFSRAATRPPAETTSGSPAIDVVEATLGDSRSRAMHWLRENGRYLAPNGSGDRLLALAVVLRNWVALHLVMATLGVAFFLALIAARASLSLVETLEVSPSWLASIGTFARDGIVGDWLWWSPYLAVAGICFGIWALPLGWAYWLTPSQARRSTHGSLSYRIPPWVTVALVVAVGSSLAGYQLIEKSAAIPFSFTVFAGGAALAAALTLVAFVRLFLKSEQREKKMNNVVSNRLRVALFFTMAFLVLGIVDSLGQTCYVALATAFGKTEAIARTSGSVTTAAGVLGGVAVFLQRVLMVVGDKAGEKRLRLPTRLLTLGAALALVGVILVAVACLAHGIAWGWRIPAIANRTAGWYVPATTIDNLPQFFHATWLLAGFVGVAFLSYAFGGTYQFLNRSSQAPLYSARLTRAYLGASNSQRAKDGDDAVVKTHSSDDIAFEDYQPHAAGGPLHLICTTLNETVDGQSQLEQQDRKGMGVAVGPVGMTVGARHHAYWGRYVDAGDAKKSGYILRTEASLPDGATRSGFQVFASREAGGWIHCEQLSLGQWIGISGAAFSTGIGVRTSLGMSLLCAIFNVRLGHWWASGVDPNIRPVHRTKKRTRNFAFFESQLARLLSVQWHLLDESLARFHGTARRNWYLSDGGHFENTACYELIRRRVPFIVLCDDGADPDYELDDLANLTRKARLDFGAEIEFLRAPELDAVLHPEVRAVFGELEQLRRGTVEREPHANAARIKADRTAMSFAHAALAKITYSAPADAARHSYLLVIKPTLTGDETIDLIEYHRKHAEFPQEPTADQFFDEAQWESYRKLGAHIGGRLFQPVKDTRHAGWAPCALNRRGLEALDARLADYEAKRASCNFDDYEDLQTA
ncbi:MAG: patatin-like phospholipase family protein [Planctomycetota bacterium]